MKNENTKSMNFWHSSKAERVMAMLAYGDGHPGGLLNWGLLHDGRVVNYTFCSEDKDHGTNYDDIAHLGTGFYPVILARNHKEAVNAFKEHADWPFMEKEILKRSTEKEDIKTRVRKTI